MNKYILYFTLIFILPLTGCKKGCTDPLGYNYNANRSIDNGRCKYHQFVSLDSIKIYHVKDENDNGIGWDYPFSWWDLTFDVFIDDELVHILPDIYSVNFSTYMTENFTVDLSDVNSLKNYDWESSEYKIVIYDYDNPNIEPVDSAVINPFYYLGSRQNDRFFDSISYDQHDLDFTAYFSWD
tara:strand:+ start:1862 stop:2407 length:546 start_codon:yes stop_codon:yes gene_type:complete